MILRTLKQLVAPDRYPLPDLPASLDEFLDESAETRIKRDLQVRKSALWHSRLLGYFNALSWVGALNLVNVALYYFTDNLMAIYAAGFIVAIILPLALFARRIVK